MERIAFFSLPRPVQERFVDAVRGAASPAPLLVAKESLDRRVLGGGVASVVFFVLALQALRVGYGDLAHRFAIAPPALIGAYYGLFALSALGFMYAARRYMIARAVPYKPGLYLFPIGVIDATNPKFSIYRVSATTKLDVERDKSRLLIEFPGFGRFAFPADNAVIAQTAAETITDLRQRLQSTDPDAPRPELALFDPLLDNGFKNPFSPAEPIRKRTPLWVKLWIPIALVAATPVGFGAWKLRNAWSEAKLYSKAVASDQTSAYRQYLARGGQNRGVIEILLPRAELRDAQTKGTVAAIEAFAEAHPNSKVAVEIQLALEAALAKELAAAEAQGTLAALRDFAARHTRHAFLKPLIARAVNARIRTTLVKLRPALPQNDAKVLVWFERLLRYSAEHGPDLEIRFRHRPQEHLDLMEASLAKNGYYSGPKSLPGQYFDAAHMQPREARVAELIAAAFNKNLEPDLIHPHLGAPLAESGAPESFAVPTLLVDYRADISGAFGSRKPRIVLAGISLICKVSLGLPKDTEPLTFKFSTWRVPDMKELTDDTQAGDVYEEMATDSFAKFTKKYLSSLFSQP